MGAGQLRVCKCFVRRRARRTGHKERGRSKAGRAPLALVTWHCSPGAGAILNQRPRRKPDRDTETGFHAGGHTKLVFSLCAGKKLANGLAQERSAGRRVRGPHDTAPARREKGYHPSPPRLTAGGPRGSVGKYQEQAMGEVGAGGGTPGH